MSTSDLGPSTADKVRAFLQSVLNPQQIAQLDQLIRGIDLDVGGTTTPGLQEGGTEPTPASLGRSDPAQDRRRKMGKDALPGRGPTDSGSDRPEYPPTSGPGLPLDRPAGFAGDAALEASTLRAALRRRGVPIGSEGTLSQLRQACRAYGVLGMAMDAAPSRVSSDVDAPLDALSRIGSLSYAGHVRMDPPRPRSGAGMALDAGNDPLSLGNMMPQLSARFAAMDAHGHNVFTVTDPAKARADDRNLSPRRRAAASVPMAFDTKPSGRSGAPSISQMFGAQFAEHLGKIGTAPR